MSTLWQNIHYKMLRSGNKLNLLIGINVIVFLAINVPAVLEHMITSFSRPSTIEFYAFDYLATTAHLPKLLTRFWTPFTYMFMHDGIFHILFNMLWLYWMGQIFEEYLGNKRTIGLYIMGGLSGALLFIACFNLFPAFSQNPTLLAVPVVGASASVMAIVVATATLLPNYTISLILIGPVKLKWLVFVILVIDFLSIVGPNAGGEIAHLGGALFGFIYIKQLQRGHDWITGIANIFKSKSKLKVVYSNTGKNSTEYPRQDEIDRILDKISQTGVDSLSRQEKETLARASKNEK
ncbi:rhomboid family intramembrane serine protease [Mucilaginibacter sp. OK283]|jgi:membrane associated rhomboid family serine protease|uniref:rhomboid family protein n=1 Tax=Mucilaginibacter sp. OK283 TaxID=1881049 RepID=UPI0008CB557D|nr:rhomboid family intramembrane serine protease [Mucilaginibacter sp. OK283]SEP36203.1 Membrane associated serine protease, rhomboid family [Mucilaginibacter sp. OK283]